MRSIAVYPKRAPRRDRLDRRRVLGGIAHLHGARMRAQKQAAFDVEGVVHRARRVVLGLIERGEIVPVGLDFRTVRNVESDRAEDGLDPLPRAHDWMDTASPAL